MAYSLKKFESEIQNLKPRFFDVYILPAFVMVYAYKSKNMERNLRRILFVSGVYMGYRRYSDYKKAAYLITQNFNPGGNNGIDIANEG